MTQRDDPPNGKRSALVAREKVMTIESVDLGIPGRVVSDFVFAIQVSGFWSLATRHPTYMSTKRHGRL
jgi:predicted metalloprotease